MSIFFNFGETIDEFDYKVINEREVRASAGIMFLLGFMSLFSVYVERTIFWAELYSITIILEFTIRVLFNPNYAPYMLIGGFFVRNQQPEWVEAKQKHFAWFLAFGLGAMMTYYILFDLVSLLRMIVCWICLALMFIESAFGICLGCLLYRKMNWKTYNCPGGICDLPAPPYNKKKGVYILLFLILFGGIYGILSEWNKEEIPKKVVIIE